MFNFSDNNKTDIHAFLLSTFQNEWDYLKVLGLKQSDLEQVPFEQIVNNPGDLVDGVVKVELKLNTLFFDLLDNLIVKHRSDGSIALMFYAEIRQADPIIAFFNILKSNLGGGYIKDSKYSSFSNIAQVRKLAAGQFETETDELNHIWLNGNITISLNYKLSPLRQLLFMVSIKDEKEPDLALREKGTIIPLLKHDIREVIRQTVTTAESSYADGRIKFIDYTFDLDPPELGIFEKVRVRVFDEEKRIDEQIQTHVTYYSKYEVDTAATIRCCDQIAKIYGKDNYGDSEMKPHELDLVEESEYWTGRSWMFNDSHGLKDLSDPGEPLFYGVSISANPDQDGLSLNILVFNKMLDYHNLMQPGSLK